MPLEFFLLSIQAKIQPAAWLFQETIVQNLIAQLGLIMQVVLAGVTFFAVLLSLDLLTDSDYQNNSE